MSTTDVSVHFHAGHNMPGYLPESEPATFATFEDAKSDMLWTLNNHADNVQSWTDEHDCDDVPCPTYGDDCGHDKSNSLSLAAEDLNLVTGPEWSDVVAGQSYWIVQCSETDCAPDDDDVQCGACPASSCVHHDCPTCGRWTQLDPCPYCPKVPPSPWPKTPAMTRAHFEYVARILFEASREERIEGPMTVARMVGKFAYHLGDTNSRFDRERFVAAATA